jgi:DNA-binding transcriptional LysR family regulator
MLDVRRLGVLREVARRGSFSAAAEALGYTQPAVSRQIAVLEAELGMTLVRRVPHGAVLTDAGRLLAERTEGLLASLSDIESELQALAGLAGGRLRLASFASAAASLVPLAIASFRRRYPAIELTVEIADPVDALPRLRAGELDIALSHDADEGSHRSTDSVTLGGVHGSRSGSGSGSGSGAGNGKGHAHGATEHVHLFDDPMYVAMPIGHDLAESAPLSLAAFAEEPWMLASTSSCPDSRLFLRACHTAGFEPRIAFQNDDYPAILGFVAAGVGVALIPDMVARGVRDDVVVRPLDPSPPSRPILAVLPSGYRSPSAVAMLEVLSEVAGAWVADRPRLAVA